MRLSKKWLNATFSSFFHPVLAPMARSAPNAKYENLWVFIRSDAHPPGGLLLPLRGNSPCVVRAGLNIRALINPEVFRQTVRNASAALFLCLLLFICHVFDHIQHLGAVAPFVVVPGDELNEVVPKHYAGPLVDYTGVGIAPKVG